MPNLFKYGIATTLCTLVALYGCASKPYLNKEESSLMVNANKATAEFQMNKGLVTEGVRSDIIKFDAMSYNFRLLAEAGLIPDNEKGPILRSIFGVKEAGDKVTEELRMGPLTSESQSVKKFSDALGRANVALKNIPLQIRWERHVDSNDYDIAMSPSPDGNGFKINIWKSPQKKFWHVQVTSDDIIPLHKDLKYRFKFFARSNQAFPLYSRLGEAAVEMGNAFKDKRITIEGDNKFHEYGIDFIPDKMVRNNYLYLQFGYAGPNTKFEIKDLEFNVLDK